MAKVGNCCGEQVPMLFLRPEEDELDQAFRHSRRQVGDIDILVPFNVIPNYFIDFAMQTAVRRTLILRHDVISPFMCDRLCRNPPSYQSYA
jgi:hypothetical protein